MTHIRLYTFLLRRGGVENKLLIKNCGKRQQREGFFLYLLPISHESCCVCVYKMGRGYHYWKLGRIGVTVLHWGHWIISVVYYCLTFEVCYIFIGIASTVQKEGEGEPLMIEFRSILKTMSIWKLTSHYGDGTWVPLTRRITTPKPRQHS